MVGSGKYLTVIVICSALLHFSCYKDSGGDVILPMGGEPSDAAGEAGTGGQTGEADTSGGVSDYYTEPAGDDSCAGCPGQLAESERDLFGKLLDQIGLPGAKVDLNVRITVEASENPYAGGRNIDLWATVVRPGTQKKLPTILVVTPYRREITLPIYLAIVSHGYNLMVVDSTGTGSSGGVWTCLDFVEQYCIKYIVDRYIPGRVWSDGTVGMCGFSYLGIIQLLTAGIVDTDASGEPAHLKAIMPLVPMADAYHDAIVNGGNLGLLFPVELIGAVDILAALTPLQLLQPDGELSDETLESIRRIQADHLANVPITLSWIADPEKEFENMFYLQKSPKIYWPVKPAGGWGFPEGGRVISNKIPVLTSAGWFDCFTAGSLNNFRYGLSRHADADRKLIIGEWYHFSGSFGFGLDSITTVNLAARWFDWKIKKERVPFMEEYPVLMYVMGENRWRAEKSWPLPESRVDRRTLFLTRRAPSPIAGDWYSGSYLYGDSTFGLSEVQDFSGDSPVLRHRPANLHGLLSRSVPRWMIGVPMLYADALKFYRDRDVEDQLVWGDERSDEYNCLTFTTGPLAEDLEIAGPLALTFWARTEFGKTLLASDIVSVLNSFGDAYDYDGTLIVDAMVKKNVQWVAELNDVFPNGRARNITSGWLSASHRQYDPSGRTGSCVLDGERVVEHPVDPAYAPFDPFYSGPDRAPRPIIEGDLYQYVIELWPTCNVFKKGHRIRVSLSASDFPHLVPVMVASDSTIVIDERHPAALDFTAVNRADEGGAWKWIGSHRDADAYLMSGAYPLCGTEASAAEYRGTAAGAAAEALGLLFFIVPLVAGMRARRRLRRKRRFA